MSGLQVLIMCAGCLATAGVFAPYVDVASPLSCGQAEFGLI